MHNDEKTMVEAYDRSTEIMNKKNVKVLIKDLEKAYNYKDRQRLFQELSPAARKVCECLGDNSKETILVEKKTQENVIKKDGATKLNVALLKNTNAKLGIYKYKPILKEAATATSYEDLYLLDKRTSKKKGILIVAGTFAILAAAITGAILINKTKGKASKKELINGNTTTTSTLDGDVTSTLSQESTNEAYETSAVNNDINDEYTIETINIDYSSPTRETTTSNNNENNNSNNSINSTVTPIRETTPNDAVTVISNPTNHSETASYETSAIPTNSDGEKTDGNGKPVETTYIVPTGTDELPIEPSKETISLEELYGETDNDQVAKKNVIEKGKAKVLVYKLR